MVNSEYVEGLTFFTPIGKKPDNILNLVTKEGRYGGERKIEYGVGRECGRVSLLSLLVHHRNYISGGREEKQFCEVPCDAIYHHLFGNLCYFVHFGMDPDYQSSAHSTVDFKPH